MNTGSKCKARKTVPTSERGVAADYVGNHGLSGGETGFGACEWDGIQDGGYWDGHKIPEKYSCAGDANRSRSRRVPPNTGQDLKSLL